MFYKLFIVCLWLLISLDLINSLRSGDKNVCEKKIEKENYQHQRDLCLAKIFFKKKCLKKLEQNKYEFINTCCDGFIEKNNQCKPNCPNCVHGDCSAPNECKCAVGFGGLNCNIECPFGKFGVNCEFDCNCIEESCYKNYLDLCRDNCLNIEQFTSYSFAKCKKNTCRPGWIGQNCDIQCPKYKYGIHCLNSCNCIPDHTSECNKENGLCICKSGYYGSSCENQCVGLLKCEDESKNNCTCSLTAEQEIKWLNQSKNELENKLKKLEMDKTQEIKQLNESKIELEIKLKKVELDKSSLEFQMNKEITEFLKEADVIEKKFTIDMIILIALILGLIGLVFLYSSRVKKLKKDLEMFDIEHSSTQSNHLNQLNQTIDSNQTNQRKKIYQQSKKIDSIGS